MKRIGIIFQIFVLVGLYSLSVQAQALVGRPTGKENIPSSDTTFEQEMLELINAARQEKQLTPLEWNENLARAARYHSYDMGVDKYFDHYTYDRKNGRLKKICDNFVKMDAFVGKSMFSRSENIGAGLTSPQEMFDEWMDSPGHRDNILDPSAKYLGVGYVFVENSEYQHYWVMCIGL